MSEDLSRGRLRKENHQPVIKAVTKNALQRIDFINAAKKGVCCESQSIFCFVSLYNGNRFPSFKAKPLQRDTLNSLSKIKQIQR